MATAGSSKRTQLVVVALPSENDYVRKISSEKEPHLTLLYLGEPDYDANQISHITEYVGYASTLLSQFTLDVERRGVLGDKNADVLFFSKAWWSSRDISRFRESILQDPLISAAYNSADQYEGWTPHLTVGYPETPAKKDPNGYDGDVTFVKFDRIALWTDDYSGPTFELKPFSYDMEVAMSQIKSPSAAMSEAGTTISHYGVKGMRWGVHKSETGGSAPSRKVRKADAKFEKAASSTRTYIEIHNRAADHANNHDIDRINNKPKYKDADFTKPSKLRDQYYKEHEDAFNKAFINAAKGMTNASGTRRYKVSVDHDGNWSIKTEEVGHANDLPIKIVPKYDATGHLLSLSIVEDELAHYGVKGMKWGVRKSETSGGSSTTPRAKPPSADYKTAASAQRKIDTGGTHTLSNQELQGLLTRMNLERQYHSMTTQTHQSEMDRGLDTVKKALKVGKTVEDVRKFMSTPTGKAVKTGLKGAFAAAAAYATGGTSAAATAGASVVIRNAANHYTNTGN